MPDKIDLRTFALAAVFSVSGDATDVPEASFLRTHYQLAGEANWPRELKRYLRKPARTDVPLTDLSGALGLDPVEILMVTLAAAVETDLLTGRAIARVQSPVGGSRPTLGLRDGRRGWRVPGASSRYEFDFRSVPDRRAVHS